MPVSPEQITALLSKYEAVIKRQAAEKKELQLQLVKARKGLEAVKGMIQGDILEQSIVDTSTMMTLGEVVEDALTEDQQKS